MPKHISSPNHAVVSLKNQPPSTMICPITPKKPAIHVVSVDHIRNSYAVNYTYGNPKKPAYSCPPHNQKQNRLLQSILYWIFARCSVVPILPTSGAILFFFLPPSLTLQKAMVTFLGPINRYYIFKVYFLFLHDALPGMGCGLSLVFPTAFLSSGH